MDQVMIERYKTHLLEMRTRLTREIADIQKAITETVVPPGDVSTVPTHPAVFDSEGLDRNVAVSRNEAHLLEEVEGALERIEAGTFGACQECGREIGRDRLDALPFTPYCIRCAEKQEEEAGSAGARGDESAT